LYYFYFSIVIKSPPPNNVIPVTMGYRGAVYGVLGVSRREFRLSSVCLSKAELGHLMGIIKTFSLLDTQSLYVL
jgi:hypothetical protein